MFDPPKPFLSSKWNIKQGQKEDIYPAIFGSYIFRLFHNVSKCITSVISELLWGKYYRSWIEATLRSVARWLRCLHCRLTEERSWVWFPHGVLLVLRGSVKQSLTARYTDSIYINFGRTNNIPRLDASSENTQSLVRSAVGENVSP